MKITEIDKTEFRTATQKGDFKSNIAYGLRNELKSIVTKYAKGDNFKIEAGKYPADLGLYYTGNDGKEAFGAGRAIIGELYGYFQDGPRKTVVRVKKVRDDEDMIKYDVIPTHDPLITHESPPSQISFWMNRKIDSQTALIGIAIDTKFK